MFAGLTRYSDWGLLVLRIALAVIFLAHGTMKWHMWSMEPNERMSAGMINLMRFLSVAEPLGAIGLIVGLWTPLASIGLSLVMLGAITLKITAWGATFMGQQGGSGWEFEFLILCSLIGLLLCGAGKFSLDKGLTKQDNA